MSGSFSWRPYISGALAGLLAIASVWISTAVLVKPKYLGASTTVVVGVDSATVRRGGSADETVTHDELLDRLSR